MNTQMNITQDNAQALVSAYNSFINEVPIALHSVVRATKLMSDIMSEYGYSPEVRAVAVSRASLDIPPTFATDCPDDFEVVVRTIVTAWIRTIKAIVEDTDLPEDIVVMESASDLTIILN